MPIMPERSIAPHKSRVVAPICGEPKKFGTSSSGLPLAGSTANTSKAAPADLAAFQPLLQRDFVDHVAARAIDQHRALLHLVEHGAVIHADRRRVARQMDRQHVGARPKFVRARRCSTPYCLQNSENIDAVAGEDLHAIGLQQLDDFLADMAAAVNADGAGRAGRRQIRSGPSTRRGGARTRRSGRAAPSTPCSRPQVRRPRPC